MEILKGLDICVKNSAVSLGKFDGLHRGHRLLLHEILEKKEFIPTVFTFEMSDTPQKYIYSQEEKNKILEEIGIRREILFPFNEQTKKMAPHDFIRDFLVAKLDVKYICVGEDFHFGKNRDGNVGILKRYASEYGYDIKIFHKLQADNETIGSTLIRKKLEDGDIAKANDLLGRNYFIEGTVIHGNALGRTLNMPTANIVPDKSKLLLPSGVYASNVKIEGDSQVYKGVTNVGRKPTIGRYDIGVETCLLDFDRDIYGKKITVEFYEYIRHEKKFPGLDELKNQMEKDKERARHILKK